MTSPYTRACPQTNFSEGGFVKKDPLSFFFISFSFSYLLSFLFLTCFVPVLFSSGSMAKGGPSDYTGEMGSQFYVN